jgi:uncharacterized protein
MKIADTYAMAAPPERVFQMLQDPEFLAKCIPGCEGLDRIAEDEYAMRMKMGIAGFSGKFDGKVRISERNPTLSFRLSVEGAGKIGFMKGDGVIAVSRSDSGSTVQFDGDVQVGGAIANVGQRLIETTAKMVIERFFDCLGQRVGA